MKHLTLPLVCLMLTACGSGELPQAEQAANKGYVQAFKLESSGMPDQAYDTCQTVIASQPESLAGQLCAKKVAELKPLVIIHGVKKDTLKYPQSTYQAYINSVISAIDTKDYAYLFVHLGSSKPIDKNTYDRAMNRVETPDFQERLQKIRQSLTALQGAEGEIDLNPAYVKAKKKNGYTEHKFYIEPENFELYEANGAFYLQR